jgi:hypothetical protein
MKSVISTTAAIAAFSLLSINSAQAALTWTFITSDNDNIVTGTIATDITAAELQGTGTVRVTVTDLLSLNINGVEIDGDFSTAIVRTSETFSDNFEWDRDLQQSTDDQNNFLIFDNETSVPNSIGFQIGHGLTGSVAARHRTFTYGSFFGGGNPNDIDFVSTNTAFSPVPEPATYALLGGLFGLGVAVARRRR